MKSVRRIVWLLTVAVAAAAVGSWFFSREIAAGVLALTSTLAAVIMAVTIYQLDLSLRHLQFDALNQTYEFLSQDVKGDLDRIALWAEEGRPVDEVLGTEDGRNTVRYASVALNKIGYFVYKGILDVSFVQEEFGGLVVRSFVAIRPYLLVMREQTEPSDEPWFMRRFFLLIAVVCQQYLDRAFGSYLGSIVTRYGDGQTTVDFKAGTLVRPQWLGNDVRLWLRRHGYQLGR